MTEHGTRYPPIGDYGLLGDCHNWALVSRHGSIDWCNFNTPRRRTVFSRILDWDRGGHCSVRPACGDITAADRRYVPDTNVLVTELTCPHGTFALTDCLSLVTEEGDVGLPPRPHDRLLRRMRLLDGEPEVRVEVEPRFEYGTVAPRVRLRDDGSAVVFGGADILGVTSDVALHCEDPHRTHGTARLREDVDVWLSLSYVQGHRLETWSHPDRDGFPDQLEETIGFWQDWAALADYDGPYRDAVVRSAIVLKSLADARTGEIVAAPTTSLPEHVGGPRNWDYRFTWIRDAAMHLDALFDLGYDREAEAFFRFLARTTAGLGEDLQVFYGPDGSHLMAEIELHDLDGYRGSRPVRVGNGAVSQFQLDIFGEFVELVWRYHHRTGDLDDEIIALVRDIVAEIQGRWEDPDQGIWEVRGDPEHFVSSKVFAWRGIDRFLAICEDLELDVDIDRWRGLHERMHARILEHGVSEDSVIVRAYGDHQADASSLLGILLGAVRPGSEVARNTVEYVRARLGDDGLLYRYRTDDGLAGEQGAFVLCCFWLVACLVEMERDDEARRLFEALLERRNDLGLLSEEIDPEEGALLGNFPQAISHSGLIDAALRIG